MTIEEEVNALLKDYRKEEKLISNFLDYPHSKNTTCFLCDNTNSNLQLHHVNPRGIFYNYVISVCVNCHAQIHSFRLTGHPGLHDRDMEAEIDLVRKKWELIRLKQNFEIILKEKNRLRGSAKN